MVNTTTMRLMVVISLAALQLVACGSEAPSSDSQSGPQPTTSPRSPEIPMVATHAASGAVGAGGGTLRAGRARFELPATWRQQSARGGMRLAQAEIPGVAGPGELAVFFFGEGQGGDAEANLQRWIGQVEPDSGETPRRESFEVGDFRIVWIDVAGTVKASSMGMGPSEDRPGSRLFGAVVEGPGGPWFFKATGPGPTMSTARDDFVRMLRSVRTE